MHSVNLHEHARKKSFFVQLLGNSDGGEEKKHGRLTFEEGEGSVLVWQNRLVGFELQQLGLWTQKIDYGGT